MAATDSNSPRRVVPRWRSFQDTAASGELGSLGPPPRALAGGLEFVKDKELAWQNHKTLNSALDILGSSIVLGFSESTQAAAEFVVEHADVASDLSISIANVNIHRPGPDPATPKRCYSLSSHLIPREKCRLHVLL